MARPIAPTPKLDEQSSIKFLNQVAKNLEKKSKAISTPKINNTLKIIMANALKRAK